MTVGQLCSSRVAAESDSPARSAGKAKVEQPSPLLADGTSFVTASVFASLLGSDGYSHGLLTQMWVQRQTIEANL